MSTEPRRFAIAQVFSAIVAVVVAPIGCSMWGFIYGNLVNGNMDPLGEVMFGAAVGVGVAFLLLVWNVLAWSGRDHERALRGNVSVIGVSALSIVMVIVVGLIRS